MPRRETFNDLMLAVRRVPLAAARQKEAAELAGLDAEEGGQPYEEAQACLLDTLLDLRRLYLHEHEWNLEQYCNVCGADGAA